MKAERKKALTREEEWQAEWTVLTAERARARQQWSSASQALAQKVRDPFGIGGLIRAHPIAAAAIGAVAGGLIAKFVADRGRAAPSGDSADKSSEQAASPPRIWSSILREAAVSLLVPWLARMLKAKFGVDIGGIGAPPAEPGATGPAQGPG